MHHHFFKKKVFTATLAALIGCGLNFSLQPQPTAAAGGWESLIGAGVQYVQLSKEIKYYNNDGREEFFEQLKSKYGVNDDPALNERLDGVMSRLSSSIAASDPSISSKPYNYFINPDTSFNAFCSLGHNMSVNTGLFSLLSNTDEIAVVIAHEMGHGQKDHPAKSMEKSMPYELIAQIYANSQNSSAGNATASIFANYATATQVTKPQEWEADNLAFTYITGAGYNPGACAAVWQRVIEKQGESSTNFVGEIFSPSDHPSNQDRRSNYEKKLNEYSNKIVSVSNGTIKIRNQVFMTVGDIDGLSGKERAYFIAGNLAAAYHNNTTPNSAYVSDSGLLMLDNQPIMTPQACDPGAEELAAQLNKIK